MKRATLPCGQRECRPLLALLDMNAKERARRYEAGEFDGQLGRFLREQAGHGDPRALLVICEWHRPRVGHALAARDTDTARKGA